MKAIELDPSYRQYRSGASRLQVEMQMVGVQRVRTRAQHRPEDPAARLVNAAERRAPVRRGPAFEDGDRHAVVEPEAGDVDGAAERVLGQLAVLGAVAVTAGIGVDHRDRVEPGPPSAKAGAAPASSQSASARAVAQAMTAGGASVTPAAADSRTGAATPQPPSPAIAGIRVPTSAGSPHTSCGAIGRGGGGASALIGAASTAAATPALNLNRHMQRQRHRRPGASGLFQCAGKALRSLRRRWRKRDETGGAPKPAAGYIVAMNRRSLLLALAALPVLAAPAAAQVNVSPINGYLQSLRSAQGRFRQSNPNGSVQTGTFYLQKPGRIRFEYDSPPGAMVIADGTWVGVFDPKSNRNPTRYPLGRTPLSLLLRDRLSLAEPGLVLGATRGADGTDITVVDPRAPREGRMRMRFSEDPVRLREWEITTKTGQRTRVALTELATGVAVDPSLFNLELASATYR